MEFNGEDLMKAVLMKIIQMEVFDNCAKDGITPEQLIDFCEWSETLGQVTTHGWLLVS